VWGNLPKQSGQFISSRRPPARVGQPSSVALARSCKEEAPGACGCDYRLEKLDKYGLHGPRAWGANFAPYNAMPLHDFRPLRVWGKAEHIGAEHGGIKIPLFCCRGCRSDFFRPAK